MSAIDTCVRRRRSSSRIVSRIDFSAERLTAGLNPQNTKALRGFLTCRGRKQYPRKSNVTFGYEFFSATVFAVRNFGFGGMHLQAAFSEAGLKFDL